MHALENGLLITALAGLMAGVGCGKANQNGSGADTPATGPSAAAAIASAPPTSEPPPAEAPKPVQHVDLEIASVANTMAFDKTALRVPTGAEVHLVFKNNSTMTTLPHNWALVNPGTEASVAAAGLKYGDKAGYIDVFNHDTLVHTPLAKQGETSEVTFTAPAPGTYPYICTVPGHYMLMKGVLTVTP
jgi:azurin